MEINQTWKNVEAISNDDIFYVKFKNNGSANININGAGSPIVFTLEDLTVDRIILTRIDFTFSIGDGIDIEKLGSATVTNGLVFNVDGSQTIMNNGDILLMGSDNSIHSARIGGTITSIINGSWSLLDVFGNGVIEDKSSLTITVNDDLSSIDYFQISASGIKID